MTTAPVWPWKVHVQLSKAVNDSDPFGYVVSATASPVEPSGCVGSYVSDPVSPLPARTMLFTSAAKESPDSVVPMGNVTWLGPSWMCVP